MPYYPNHAVGALTIAVLCLLFMTTPLAAGEPPRIGDPESVFDPSKFDERFPDAKIWAACGVQGGIPHRDTLPIVARLNPGDDINAAIAKAGKGVVLLGEGVWKLDKGITLASNVVLRGDGRDKTKLENYRQGTAISGKKIERFGVEDLSIEGAAKGSPKAGDGISLEDCSNGWVQNVRISRTSWRPMRTSIISIIRTYNKDRHILLTDQPMVRMLPP